MLVGILDTAAVFAMGFGNRQRFIVGFLAIVFASAIHTNATDHPLSKILVLFSVCGAAIRLLH